MEKTVLKRHEIMVLCLVLIMAIGFGVLTAVRKNQPGVIFEGGFLALSREGEGAVYSGKADGKQVRIVVTPEEKGTDVLVYVEDELIAPYRVMYPEGSVTYLGVSFPRIEIYREETLLFQGGYDPEPLRFGTFLRDAEGKPYRSSEEDADSPEDFPGYRFYMSNIYYLSCQQGTAVRGNWAVWLMTALLSLLVVVDVYNPYAVYWFFLHTTTDKTFSCRTLLIRRGVMLLVVLIGYLRGVGTIDYL